MFRHSEHHQQSLVAAARVHAEKLAGFMLQIPQMVGVDGRLFGSVTEALIAQGFELVKAEIRMPDGPDGRRSHGQHCAASRCGG